MISFDGFQEIIEYLFRLKSLPDYCYLWCAGNYRVSDEAVGYYQSTIVSRPSSRTRLFHAITLPQLSIYIFDMQMAY